uniref:Uncharacterized protein n=1 Tax=Moorena producens (strain JHB) TaxID=1454205 RepID=A0A1D9GA30_MOOP1|nr:hypothetical protein [Moorena producens]
MHEFYYEGLRSQDSAWAITTGVIALRIKVFDIYKSSKSYYNQLLLACLLLACLARSAISRKNQWRQESLA